MVAHQPLELRVMVRIHAGQPIISAYEVCMDENQKKDFKEKTIVFSLSA